MSKKKILIVFNKYKEFGGEEAAFANEVSFYKKIYSVKSIEFSNKRGINILFSIFNPFSFFKTLYWIIVFKPDIIYFNNLWFTASNSPILASMIFNKSIKKIKLHNFRLSCSKADHYLNNKICTKCDLKSKKYSYKYRCYKNSLFTTLLVNCYTKLQSKLIKSNMIDEILVLNDHQKKLLIDFGIIEKKIKISKNIINIENSTKDANILKQKKTFLYIGRLEEEKGILDIIEVWKSLEIKDMNLKIIGEGSLSKHINEYTKEIKNIEYVGYMRNELIHQEILKARCIVFPTRLIEGQPTVILESMKCGVPVIAPNISFFQTFDKTKIVTTYELGDIQSLRSLLEKYFDFNFYQKQKNQWQTLSSSFFN